MSVFQTPSAKNWTDPNVCPFCEAPLADPGAGFIDHLRDNPGCSTGFERWRDNVGADIGGTWSG